MPAYYGVTPFVAALVAVGVRLGAIGVDVRAGKVAVGVRLGVTVDGATVEVATGLVAVGVRLGVTVDGATVNVRLGVADPTWVGLSVGVAVTFDTTRPLVRPAHSVSIESVFDCLLLM